jgi:IS30 family transposase
MKGQKIVMEVMKERRVGRYDFFISRLPHHVRARKVAIKRLKEAGYSNSAIGRFMQRDPTTITYWTRPEVRIRKNAYGRAYAAARRSQSRNCAEASL